MQDFFKILLGYDTQARRTVCINEQVYRRVMPRKHAKGRRPHQLVTRRAHTRQVVYTRLGWRRMLSNLVS